MIQRNIQKQNKAEWSTQTTSKATPTQSVNVLFKHGFILVFYW